MLHQSFLHGLLSPHGTIPSRQAIPPFAVPSAEAELLGRFVASHPSRKRHMAPDVPLYTRLYTGESYPINSPLHTTIHFLNRFFAPRSTLPPWPPRGSAWSFGPSIGPPGCIPGARQWNNRGFHTLNGYIVGYWYKPSGILIQYDIIPSKNSPVDPNKMKRYRLCDVNQCVSQDWIFGGRD